MILDLYVIADQPASEISKISNLLYKQYLHGHRFINIPFNFTFKINEFFGQYCGLLNQINQSLCSCVQKSLTISKMPLNVFKNNRTMHSLAGQSVMNINVIVIEMQLHLGNM